MGFIIENESDNFAAVEMDFKIEAGGTTIQLRDPATLAVLEVQPANTLEAVANGAAIRIQLLGGEKILVDALEMATTSINGLQVTQVQATALTELNNLFVNVGAAGSSPVISNTTPIHLIQGQTLNMSMTGSSIVAYSWQNLPSGVVPVNGNERNIIGGSLLPLGTYQFTARATNYYAETVKQLELVVGTSFVNSKSFYGGASATNKHYLVDSAITSQSSSPLFRAANSTGNASDSTYAWSVSWHQKSNATHGFWWGSGLGAQFGIGGTRQNRAWAGFDVNVWGDSTKTILQIMYGSKFAYLDFKFELTGTALSSWKHIVLTYNGGDTDNTTNPYGSTGVQDSFQVYINGANVPITSATYGGTGFSNVINADGFSGFSKDLDFRIGLAEYAPANFHSNELYIDELGVYDYVLSSSEIYTLWNGGTPAGLNNIASITNPVDYFRMGDGEDPTNAANNDVNQFPVMYNYYSGRFNMEATNMTIADLVNDTP